MGIALFFHKEKVKKKRKYFILSFNLFFLYMPCFSPRLLFICLQRNIKTSDTNLTRFCSFHVHELLVRSDIKIVISFIRLSWQIAYNLSLSLSTSWGHANTVAEAAFVTMNTGFISSFLRNSKICTVDSKVHVYPVWNKHKLYHLSVLFRISKTRIFIF